MRKHFLIFGFAGAMLASGLIVHAGTNGTSTNSSTTTTTSSSSSARRFTLDHAILTALQRNPDILRAKQEIERSRGVVLEISAQALPHITPEANLVWRDSKLGGGGSLFIPNFSGGGGGGGGGGLNNIPASQQAQYQIQIIGRQLVFNYSTLRQIRGTFFQRDSAYFAFRNTVDQVISTVKTQFYQIVVNKALIGVQEESVHLLESQLKDQQNRFEAGTVPRFNVLQAEVALYNQIPNLITARNNFRISQLVLAKTLGLDFDPLRGDQPPLEAVGEMPFIPLKIGLVEAIELGKQRRPFLKQARANVLNQVEQVHVALGGFLPNFTTTGGYEIDSGSSELSLHNTSKGYTFGLMGTWNLWDSGETYGRLKQQRALLSESKITYDDDVRQVELEVQQSYSNLQQNRELIQSQEKNVEQANEALRLAKARLDAGAGTQLDVLNAQVQLLTAQSTKLQALFGYNSSLAEFDRVTGAQSVYTESFNHLAPRTTRSRTYDTGSGVSATGKPKTSSKSQAPLRPARGLERVETASPK